MELNIIQALKLFTATSCAICFFCNSFAIFKSFIQRSTTTSTQKEDVNLIGFKPPRVTICATKPFSNFTWDNATYEAYDKKTVSKEDIIKSVGLISFSGKSREAHYDVEVLYTVEKGRCYIVNLKNNVCQSI